jgi:prevent-host-death family protein
MIATLKDSKARLSTLVDLASKGEEVVITVRGKPKARLCALAPPAPTALRAWARELREARTKWSRGVHDSSPEILDDIRSDRA